MKTRCVTSLLVIASCLLLTQPLLADDLADLKTAHQMYDKAWSSGDLAAAFEIWQDGGIWVPISNAFPIVTDSANGIQMFTKWLETHIYRYSWYKIDYRVSGNTGFVWGVRTTNVIVKATGTGKRNFLKTTMVFMKIEGKWKAVMLHDSTIASEVDIF